jgi:hypothetical protein
MSVENFKPTIWSDLIFMEYDKSLVFAPLMNRDYEGEIQGYGDKVKINEIGDVTVNTYSGTVTYENLSDASKFLLIDQQKYAAIQLDDVDGAQAKPKVMGEAARKIGVGLAEDMDAYLASLSSEGGIVGTVGGTSIGTTGTPISITSANVTTYLALVAQGMDENNCPQAGRVAVVPPWFIQKLTLAKINKDTDNSGTLTTGYVTSYYGFDIYMSNNITHSGTTWYKPMFFLRNNTIAFAEQLMTTEAMRSETSFKDKLRSLAVYGGKVVRPNSLAVPVVAAGAES